MKRDLNRLPSTLFFSYLLLPRSSLLPQRPLSARVRERTNSSAPAPGSAPRLRGHAIPRRSCVRTGELATTDSCHRHTTPYHTLSSPLRHRRLQTVLNSAPSHALLAQQSRPFLAVAARPILASLADTRSSPAARQPICTHPPLGVSCGSRLCSSPWPCQSAKSSPPSRSLESFVLLLRDYSMCLRQNSRLCHLICCACSKSRPKISRDI